MKKNYKGFSLIEMLLVVALIAIIAAVAIPSYNRSVIKSKRAIGKAELMKVLSRQEQFFINNKAYATTLTALGYGSNPYFIDDGGDPTAVGSSIYQIAFAAGATTSAFTIQAIPQNGQSGDSQCATLQLTSTGTKLISGGTSSATDCW